MTPYAARFVRLIIAAKGAAARPVTLKTIIYRACHVLKIAYRCYLLSLRQAGPHVVAPVTTFAGVILMAENIPWVGLRRQGADVICELVAYITGIILILRDIRVFRLMAVITIRMGLKT